MCGIAGGIKLPSDRLDRMLDSLRHRGPDGSGSFIREPFRCGMTRLAILDLESGKQPFSSPDGRIHALCNGEIYNWRALRAELEKEATVSTPSVIPRSFPPPGSNMAPLSLRSSMACLLSPSTMLGMIPYSLPATAAAKSLSTITPAPTSPSPRK